MNTATTFSQYDIVSYGSQTKMMERMTVGIPMTASQGRNLPIFSLELSMIYDRAIVIKNPMSVDAMDMNCKSIGLMPIVLPTRKLVAVSAILLEK